MSNLNSFRVLEKAVEKVQCQERKLREQRQRTCISQPRYPMFHAYCQHGLNHCQILRRSEPSGTDSSASIDVLLGNLSLRASLRSDLLAADHALCQSDCPNTNNEQTFPMINNNIKSVYTRANDDGQKKTNESEGYNKNAQGDGLNVLQQTEGSSEIEKISGNGDCKQTCLSKDYELEFGKEENLIDKHVRLPDWNPRAVERPIENEEWVAFLQRSMEEVMEGEVVSLLQQNCVSVFVSPLRNQGAGCRVVEYVACLLSLPFVISVSRENLEIIERVYLDVRVVPNLVYAIKLLMSERSEGEAVVATGGSAGTTRSASTLSADELQALECTMLLLCRLVYVQEQFLTQFCDAVYIVNGMPLLQQLLTLEKRKARVVADLIAILNNILRSQPENAELVEKVVLQSKTNGI